MSGMVMRNKKAVLSAPVAASSPKLVTMRKSEMIDAFIEEQRQQVEKLKAEVNRITKLQILKIGPKIGLLPFTKSNVSKNLLENFNKVLANSKGSFMNAEELKSINFNLSNGVGSISSIMSGETRSKAYESPSFGKILPKKAYNVKFRDEHSLDKAEPLEEIPNNRKHGMELRRSSRLNSTSSSSNCNSLLKKKCLKRNPNKSKEVLFNTMEEDEGLLKTLNVKFRDEHSLDKRECLEENGMELRSSSRLNSTSSSNCNGLLKKKCMKRNSNKSKVLFNTMEEDEGLFKTPPKKSKSCYSNAVASVTPGPNINKPMSVLRKPQMGEVAISLHGSPLLVSSDAGPTNLPQINVPTKDGKVLAILPREGFKVDDLPLLNTPTKVQLKTLSRHLNNIISQ